MNAFDRSVGDLDTTGQLTIQAASGASVTIDGNGHDRIFTDFSTGSLMIEGLTLTGGYVDDPTPGSSVSGGAISMNTNAPLTISDTTLTGNSADGTGGAINAGGSTTITNSTISGNTSREAGGAGITVTGAGGSPTLAIDSSTISANVGHADGTAGGSSIAAGGVAAFGAPTITVHNSIIAGNRENSPTFDQPDCTGSLTSLGGNVMGSTTGCTFTSMPSDSLNDPNAAADLTTLGMRGGPTPTHALLPGNPAIDRGDATCLPNDQRGVARDATCDSGAFEKGPDHNLTVTVPGNGTVTGSGIACPPDCAEPYSDGSDAPLTATPAAGFTFAAWSGDCSGAGACVPIMNVDRSVGASFAAIPLPAPTATPTAQSPRKKKCKKRKKHRAAAAKKCKRKRRT